MLISGLIDLQSMLTVTHRVCFAILILLISKVSLAQRTTIDAQQAPQGLAIQYDNQGRPVKARKSGEDSLKKRNALEDSITISYKFWDSTKLRLIDSTINNFSNRFPSANMYAIDIGNMGNATRQLFFTPIMKAGFDAGFHAYDAYKFTLENSKFYTTTRPYTELGYLLGSKAEQFIHLKHTQNRSSNLNFNFEYRLINGPGAFKNQNTAHNNIRINISYVSNNKRYSNYFIFLNNKLRSSENGGLRQPSKIDSLQLNDPFELETKIGSTITNGRNPFSTRIVTGTLYDENIVVLRQQYDIGQKDSIVTDSSTIKLFYPRFRLQHTFKYAKNSYTFQDLLPVTADYQQYFSLLIPNDSINFTDTWRDITNEFSIISYPEKNNLHQFLKLGTGLQLLQGNVSNQNTLINNLYLLAEYRNRTKNLKWDILANGKLFVTGIYASNYEANAQLKRKINDKIGMLTLGFQNVNRTPSYVFNNASSFPVINNNALANENISHVYGEIENNRLHVKLNASYFIASNYTYFNSYFNANQEATLFNILRIGLSKKITIAKNLYLYSDIQLQQATNNAPVNIPFLVTINRLAFEGNFFKNLRLSTGVEARYYSNYKSDNYSPILGQFFLQNEFKTSNRPDVNYFLHFNIKTFRGFIRLENLNSLQVAGANTGFTKRNFHTPNYASNTMWLRVGIWWTFVN